MTNLFINSSPGCDYPKRVAKAVFADSNMKKNGWSDSTIVDLSLENTIAGRH